MAGWVWYTVHCSFEIPRKKKVLVNLVIWMAIQYSFFLQSIYQDSIKVRTSLQEKFKELMWIKDGRANQ